jgi:cardiolipin synthase
MTALILAEWLVRLVMFFVIVMRKRAPAKALGWLTVVAFVPFAGTLLYITLGELRLGRRRELRYTEFEDALAASPRLRRQVSAVYQPLLEEPDRSISHLVARVGGTPAYGGHDVELIGDTAELFARVCADIERAWHHCHLLFYIANDDAHGRAVAAALIRAQERGVSCRLALDAAGSRVFLRSDTARRLRAAKVQVIPLLPVSALRATVARLDLRNHRKLVVIDGRIGYTGGHNLTTPRYPGRERFGDWIDVSVRMTGPLVNELQEIFLHDCAFDGHAFTTEEEFFPSGAEMSGRMNASLLATGPLTTDAPLVDVIAQAIALARERVVLTTPYFAPHESVLSGLRRAALRGVAVVLIVPLRSDHALTQAAGRSQYGYLLEAGVEIREFEGGLLHAKTLTVDRSTAMISTANLDLRSFELNFELALLVYDSDFAARLHFLQTDYVERSRPVSLQAWSSRSFGRRLADDAAKLVAPLL